MTSPRLQGASVPTDASPTAGDRRALRGAVEVYAEKSGRVGLLSYLVPEGMKVHAGDAVNVPFGAQTKYGMVVGPAPEPDKATREILEVFGRRSDPRDIALARNIARFHFAEVPTVLARLAPRSGRGADAVHDEVVTLANPALAPAEDTPRVARRRLLVRAPLIDSAELAAAEAARLVLARPDGQVLVLCPTTASVVRVVAQFTTGAQRLDSRARRGAWKGFAAGSVRIGVGTRTSALYAAAHLVGIVVVDEDHPGHIEGQQPHTHARDIASARARSLNVPLTLISANPSPAALGAGVRVEQVGTRADWPTMRLIDRGQVDPIQRWAPDALQRAIAAENKAGRTPWVVAQRKAATRRCSRCGTPRPCGLCESSLCRHPAPEPCPRCESTDAPKVVGWDRSRIDNLLNPPSDSGKPARVRVVGAAELADAHDVGLVVLFDIDAALHIPELIPEAFGASLITAAAAAAGRGGSLVALTDNPRLAALTDLFGPRDQAAVARRALAAAKSAQLPPFGRLVTIRTAQVKRPNVSAWPGQVLGPAKVGAEWEILVRIPADKLLDLAPAVARIRRGTKARVTVT